MPVLSYFLQHKHGPTTVVPMQNTLYGATPDKDDDGDGEEPSRITLHSEGTHRTRGASTYASDGSYHPGRPSGPRQSSEESATTTEGQGQEQEHDGTQGGEA
jgi:hypothetical protein